MKVYALSLCYSFVDGSYSTPIGIFSDLQLARDATSQQGAIERWEFGQRSFGRGWWPVYRLGPTLPPCPFITEHEVDEDYQEAAS